jgi:glycosyltransferase involved in cell wall biosynthesis
VTKQRQSVGSYIKGYTLFFLYSFVALSLMHLRARLSLIQFFNIPDFLVFSAILPKLAGTPLVFDYRDAMPDQYVSKYGLPWSHPMIVLLRAIERAAMRFCDHVVTVHEPYRRLAVERGARPEQVSIFMNFPDPNLFDRDKYVDQVPSDKRFRVMYHGTIAPRFDLDTVLRAVKILQPRIPCLEVEIIGDGDARESLRAHARQLGVDQIVSIPGPIPLNEVPARIASADVGLAPAKPDMLEDLVLSTKLLEYLAMGKPVVATRRTILLDYVGEEALLYYDSGDAAGLAERIHRLYLDSGERSRLRAAGDAFMQRYPWPEIKRQYLRAVATLVGRCAGSRTARCHRPPEGWGGRARTTR